MFLQTSIYARSGLLGLAVAFTILKLTGNIKGSWLALLSPMWGLMIVAFIAGFFNVPLDLGK